jgi:putative ABC transport system permease protein
MKLGESLRISWRAITGHKLRSTLTAVGIIIGVGAVITFMVLGGGFKADLLVGVQSEESSTIQVVTQTGPFDEQIVTSSVYTEHDVEVVEAIDGVEWVAPEAFMPATQLDDGNETVTGGVGGTGIFAVSGSEPERFDIDVFEMVEGDPFSAPNEAVVNTQLSELFAGNLTVGDTLNVSLIGDGKKTFTVSGIVENDVFPGTPPRITIPLDPHYNVTVETARGEQRAFSGLLLNAESLDRTETVRNRVDEYFRTESDARELKQEDHTIAVQTVEDAIDQFTDIINELALFLGGIAAIALVVGSIGIANIMIVSVTERTREIGVMKAVGARERDILQLFLVEALVLGLIGAIGGVVAGLAAGFLAVTIMGWPMHFPVDWMLVAVAVGIVASVFSGLYPAWRAARVDPIEALRRE